MARRSVFISKAEYPYFEEIMVEMEWFGGFALSQKRKCEIGLHRNFNKCYPARKILEVSGASTNPLGKRLSAMNLTKEVVVDIDGVKHRGISSVESVFQSSRIYDDGKEQIGPFEYVMIPGKECKRLVKDASKGLHSYRYFYENHYFYAPDYHISLFYDYVYMNALLEERNSEVMKSLIDGGYSAFSDLATVALNSQARSCAIFVGLYRAGLLDKIKSVDSYLKLFRTSRDGKPELGAYENAQVFRNGKINLLSEVVPCAYNGDDVIRIFNESYSHLSNKKDNNVFEPYLLD